MFLLSCFEVLSSEYVQRRILDLVLIVSPTGRQRAHEAKQWFGSRLPIAELAVVLPCLICCGTLRAAMMRRAHHSFHSKDATNERMSVLLDSGIDHLEFWSLPSLSPVAHGRYRLAWKELYTPGCVAFSRTHAEVKVSERGSLSDERKSNLTSFPWSFFSIGRFLSFIFLDANLRNERVERIRKMRSRPPQGMRRCPRT